MTHTYELSPLQREGLLYGHEVAPEFSGHLDATGPGTPRQQLWNRVERAMSRGLLEEVRAHALLGVPLSAPLPFGAHPSVLDPLSRVRHAVARHLEGLGRKELTLRRVELDPSGYRVELGEAWPDETGRPWPDELHVNRDFGVV